MYCIHKSMRGVELPRRLPHRNVERAEIILHPCMGGHCVVPRNDPAYLGTKVVKDGPAWRVLDDEFDQLHRKIGQVSGCFSKKDGKVIRVSGEISEDGPIPSYLVSGPDLLDPEHASSWEDGVAVGIEHRLGKVGRGDRVADGQSGVLGKGSTGAKVGARRIAGGRSGGQCCGRGLRRRGRRR
jgi:hypothetical protein